MMPWVSAIPQYGITVVAAVFAQVTAKCPFTLRCAAPSPRQNCPSPWGIWTPNIICFPGPTRVLNPNSVSIGSAIFVVWQIDRQTRLLGR